ncbi:MAG: hypothetical protein Q4D22_04390 [Candidatus Saccharibacteria bacterium]|nr:hypothetical protein [Candidatus Saccharibacteria bacterium]
MNLPAGIFEPVGEPEEQANHKQQDHNSRADKEHHFANEADCSDQPRQHGPLGRNGQLKHGRQNPDDQRDESNSAEGRRSTPEFFVRLTNVGVPDTVKARHEASADASSVVGCVAMRGIPSSCSSHKITSPNHGLGLSWNEP